MASIAEEVHREMFEKSKAKGDAHPTTCAGYLQVTTQRIIARFGMTPEDRARLQSFFYDGQVIRNLVNNKLGLKVAGERRRSSHFCFFVAQSLQSYSCISSPSISAVFPHVVEFEKEKAAAAAAAQAAQLAADRLGEFNVPLVDAAEEELTEWMQRFMADRIETESGVAQFKSPTPALKNATNTICTRSLAWKQQHTALEHEIATFTKALASAYGLAFNI